jgi:hypothetical protein
MADAIVTVVALIRPNGRSNGRPNSSDARRAYRECVWMSPDHGDSFRLKRKRGLHKLRSCFTAIRVALQIMTERANILSIPCDDST